MFEHNAFYRAISTTGSFAQFRMLRHPVLGSKDDITGVLHGFVDRRRALECVVDVPPEVQARLTEERQRLQLPPEDPLTEEDHKRYRDMLARMDDPTEDPQEHGVDDLDELMQLDDLTEDDELSNLASNVRPTSNFEQCCQGVRDRESSDVLDSVKSVTNGLAVPGRNVLARTTSGRV